MSSDSPSRLVSGDVTGEGAGTRISADEGAGNGLSAGEDLRSWTDAGRIGLEPNSEVANGSGDDNSDFIAAQFILALQNRGIRMPPSVISEINTNNKIDLPILRVQAGMQPKASKLPPLIPTFAAKVAITGFQDQLPQLSLQQKLSTPLQVATWNAPTTLPTGSKLLQISNPLLPAKCLEGGAFVSSQQPDQSEVDRVISKFHDGPNVKVGRCETQVWGVPWTEDDFVQQMVKFGHPATLKSALPDILTETVEFYRRTPAHERAEYRASRLGFWLRKMVELKADEQKLKAAMDPDVALILKSKNILLWEEMLAMTGYKDMGVVQEFKEGTDLVGCTPKTGLWPSKFQPATITVAELHDVACKERDGLHEQFSGFAKSGFKERCGEKQWRRLNLVCWRDRYHWNR